MTTILVRRPPPSIPTALTQAHTLHPPWHSDDEDDEDYGEARVGGGGAEFVEVSMGGPLGLATAGDGAMDEGEGGDEEEAEGDDYAEGVTTAYVQAGGDYGADEAGGAYEGYVGGGTMDVESESRGAAAAAAPSPSAVPAAARCLPPSLQGAPS